MPGISHSVTPVVDEIGKMHIEGNIIPPSWLNHLRTKKGKPSALAAMILGDIIYWYRPTVIRDEQTGQVVEVRKKFNADKLQRDTRYYVQLFGCTKWQALEALNVLLAAGVIMREERTITLPNGTQMPHVYYLEPVPAKIAEITYRIDGNQRPAEKQTTSLGKTNNLGRKTKRGTPEKTSNLGENSLQPRKENHTYTNTTPETSSETTSASSSPVVVVVPPAAAANKAAKDISPELLKEAHELLRDFYGVTFRGSRTRIIKNLAARPDLMLRVIRQYGDEIQANHRLDEHYNCAGALVKVLCDLDMGMFVPK